MVLQLIAVFDAASMQTGKLTCICGFRLVIHFRKG